MRKSCGGRPRPLQQGVGLRPIVWFLTVANMHRMCPAAVLSMALMLFLAPVAASVQAADPHEQYRVLEDLASLCRRFSEEKIPEDQKQKIKEKLRKAL